MKRLVVYNRNFRRLASYVWNEMNYAPKSKRLRVKSIKELLIVPEEKNDSERLTKFYIHIRYVILTLSSSNLFNSLQLEKLTEKEKEKRDAIVAEKKSLEQSLENVKKEVIQYEEKETQLIRIIKNVSFQSN